MSVMPIVQREWVVAGPHPLRETLAREANVSPLVAQLMLNRGVTDLAGMREFLSPRMSGLHPPESLPGATAAGERLARAARERRRIVIYGDYDVDGITATAILWHALRLAGADVNYYVPSRFDEGYGLNGEALERLAADGARVVITVDCGITAVAEARRARELGIELIITDHHEPKDDLPAADVLVHPRACGPSPNGDLCGAAVALKVAWALGRSLSAAERVSDAYRQFLLDSMALAALGLIADVAPLTGENRVIAREGLHRLCHSTNPGVVALLEVAGLTRKAACDDYDVGFLLAPRLNAMGRMGHAKLAVELFTQADAVRAAEIAAELDTSNRQRQNVERTIVQQAIEMVRQRGFDRDGCRAIVLASAEWHVGVIGIVAARLVDRFHRPAVLIALENGHGQGSGRSVRHFPLHEALRACEQHLVSHGGHAMAAGVRLRAEQVEPFTGAFQAQAAARLTASDLRPRLRVDDEVTLDALNVAALRPVFSLAPFGPGNPRPLLVTGPVELADRPRVVGTNGAHLQLTVREGRTFRKAIAFNMGRQAEAIGDHPRLRLAFEPILSAWNGSERIELKVKDWKPAD